MLSGLLSAPASTATHTAQVVGQVAPLDIGVAAAAIVGAFVLQFVRRMNGRTAPSVQWLSDALSVGTLLLLAIIAFNATAADYFGWNFDGVTDSNGILILIALTNCIVMICQSLWESSRKLPRKA